MEEPKKITPEIFNATVPIFTEKSVYEEIERLLTYFLGGEPTFISKS